MKRRLDPSLGGKHIDGYRQILDQYVKGQKRAKEVILKMLVCIDAGVNDPGKPLGVIALFGPSGVGKTELVKTLARIWFDDPNALTIIQGQEFSESHTISKLIGSPSGYVGYDDPRDQIRNNALLSQVSIETPGKRALFAKVQKLEDEVKKLEVSSVGSSDRTAGLFRAEDLRREIASLKVRLSKGVPSIVLFDESEKMHPKVLQVLLGILNEGYLALMNNEVVDFTRTIICLTGNIGERELSKIARDTKLGFSSGQTKSRHDKNQESYNVVRSRFRKTFGAPLTGRIGDKHIIVCQQLTYDEMMEIFTGRVLAEILSRLAQHPKKVRLLVDEAVKKMLVSECFNDPDLGARSLSNLVDDRILGPLTGILAKDEDEGGIPEGAKVFVALDNSTQKIIFECEE